MIRLKITWWGDRIEWVTCKDFSVNFGVLRVSGPSNAPDSHQYHAPQVWLHVEATEIKDPSDASDV